MSLIADGADRMLTVLVPQASAAIRSLARPCCGPVVRPPPCAPDGRPVIPGMAMQMQVRAFSSESFPEPCAQERVPTWADGAFVTGIVNDVPEGSHS
jgi:hypothetical protein